MTPTDTVTYTYGDTNWGDLLTAYDGQTLTYDQIGNLTGDGEWTYTWKHGRQLASATSNGTTWNYTYNDAGLRTGRTNGTSSYRYVYSGSQLSRMTKGSTQMRFTYAASGAPLMVNYGGTNYYYVTNLQGDVTGIRNASGQAVVTYTYDAWGNLLSTTGSMANTLGQDNPLRYRGYVYDLETGLYYLQSRYYDPEMGRFLNADAFASTGQGLTGNNMFAYCGNNPVVYTDPAGTARTYSVQMTDTGYNTQARAYSAKEIRDDNPIFSLTKTTKNAKKALWDAYVHSNELQIEQQYQQDMAIRQQLEDTFSSPSRLGDFAGITFANATAYAGYVNLVAATTVTPGGVVLTVVAIAFAIRSTLQYYDLLPEISWEDLRG